MRLNSFFFNKFTQSAIMAQHAVLEMRCVKNVLEMIVWDDEPVESGCATPVG